MITMIVETRIVRPPRSLCNIKLLRATGAELHQRAYCNTKIKLHFWELYFYLWQSSS